MNDQTVQHRTTTATTTVLNLAHKSLSGVHAALPNGLAVRGDTLFFDTDRGNGFADGSGLWAYNLRTRHIRALWVGSGQH